MEKNEIDKTLTSLDDMNRASAPARFKEQLMHRIQNTPKKKVPWYFQLKYGVAAMLALLLLNGYILFLSNFITDQEEITAETLAEEWYVESDIIEYEYEIE